MTHALITGSTGFIGRNLVGYLLDRGLDVTCLVRPTSDRSGLSTGSINFVDGDVTDRESVSRAIADVDVVYHLAGLTKSFRKAEFFEVNEVGVENVASACAARSGDVKLVLVSSIAAAGPSHFDVPRTESDTASPVSNYGRSKLAGELAARRYATKFPITIVRPPIVLGEGDHDGFALFEGIARFGIHAVPGFGDNQVSVIDAKDLAAALVLVAEKGQRLSGKNEDCSEGVYFASADETPTYAELGRLIGRAVGREQIRVVHFPLAGLWAVAGISEIVGRIQNRPRILNLDKTREAFSGTWTCSSERLKTETGFMPALPLATRINHAAQWYADNGWLRMKSPRQTRHQSELQQIQNVGQNDYQ